MNINGANMIFPQYNPKENYAAKEKGAEPGPPWPKPAPGPDPVPNPDPIPDPTPEP